MARCKIEREKFYPGQGLEPGPLALRASALTIKPSTDLRYILESAVAIIQSYVFAVLRTLYSREINL